MPTAGQRAMIEQHLEVSPLLTAMLLLLLASPDPTVHLETPDMTDQFQIVGQKIFDPHGEEFVIRGVNVEGMKYGWRGNVVDEADLLIEVWGFNTLRVNCRLYPQIWRGQNVSPRSHYQSLEQMRAIVDTFTPRGVVVIFEFHDRTGRYYEGDELEDLKQAFRRLVELYGDNPYVWFNIMNEPGGRNSLDRVDQWLHVHREVIGVIRDELSNDNVIVVDGHFWGQDRGLSRPGETFETHRSAILNHGPALLRRLDGERYRNITFGLHVYDQWNVGSTAQAEALLRDYLRQASERDLHVHIGEWGSAVSGEDRYFPHAARAVMRVAPELGIGRIFWAWRGADPFRLTTDGGGHRLRLDAQGQPVNLSWLGELVWIDLRTGSLLTAPASD